MRKNPRRILSYTRTENKGLTAFETNCHELRQLTVRQRLVADSVVPSRTSSGMLVVTKLGTIDYPEVIQRLTPLEPCYKSSRTKVGAI